MKLPIFLPVVALLLMTIGGCATLPGTPPPAVDIPNDCDALAKPVPLPAIVSGEDLGYRADKFAAVAVQANARLVAHGKCDVSVRESFAGKAAHE